MSPIKRTKKNSLDTLASQDPNYQSSLKENNVQVNQSDDSSDDADLLDNSETPVDEPADASPKRRRLIKSSKNRISREPNKLTKRSIRNISRDSESTKRNGGQPAFADGKRFSSRRYKSAGNKKLLTFVGVAVLAILLFIGVSSFSHSANVSIETQTFSVSFPDSITVEEDQYALQDVTIEESESVLATGSEEVSRNAVGTITISNTSANDERLIANTRFASNNGSIYRIGSAVVVPGGSQGSPGQLTNVEVTADEPGEEFNLDSGQVLTVPGLEGTELAEAITATTDSAIAGGFVGETSVADPDEVDDAIDDLQDELESNFINRARSEFRDQVILVSSPSLEFSTTENNGSNDSVDVVVSATAEVPTVSVETLIRLAIANGQVANLPSATDGLEILNLNEIEATSTIDAEDTLTLTLNTPVILGVVRDEAAIAQALVGQSVEEVQEVFEGEAGISSFDLTISPFWRSTLPNNVDKITVEIVGDSATEGIRNDRAELEVLSNEESDSNLLTDNVDNNDGTADSDENEADIDEDQVLRTEI